ncbi:MAG: glycosyltransferase, partial [Caldisericaceae bacterium]
EAIDAYYRYMDLGLVLITYSPHYERKLPTKFFEYMLAGIPFIATDFPRWKKFVEENECGFTVNPDDFDEIANKIQYLMKHPDERKLMGQKGRESVLANYTWDKEAEKLEKLYEELLVK